MMKYRLAWFWLVMGSIGFVHQFECAAKERNRSFTPDPVAVQREGSGWRYPQDGWIVVHIEGTPYERGYQHGKLLAHEIVDYCETIARVRNEQAPDKAWRDLRLFGNALFLRHFDKELLREMQGIADGAAEAGAKLDGRLLDLIDIVVINADVELGFLESALEGTPTGIDHERFRGRHGSPLRAQKQERCSAFVATGTATADGKIVMGHITMSSLPWVRFFNIWLDLQPSEGHRVAFQTFPGGVQSGLDYYISDSGLIVAETTIDQTKYDPNGEMLASRIRRAVQYADSIDQCVEILKSSSNGLYTDEWLFGDIKTNEIAMFELGTEHSRLWRSSRNEWVGGTSGFYWGCNNVKDVNVFKETVADLSAKPANLVLHPRIRDEAWLKLFSARRGRIDEAFGFEAFSTPPLVGYPSCDAKFTTAEMAKEMTTWAFFGPPLGHTWIPSAHERAELSTVEPLVAHDWTLIDVKGVSLPSTKDPKRTKPLAVDLEPFPSKGEQLHVEFDAKHPFAWRGTILPKEDGDLWLAAAFAEYEQIVSLEHAVEFHESRTESLSGSLSEDKKKIDVDADVGQKSENPGHELVDLALFQHESNWLTSARRLGHDIPLSKIQPDAQLSDWYRIAVGKGVMLLATLRQEMGIEPFAKMMDEFGRNHAGQEISTREFREHLGSVAKADVVALFDRWVTGEVSDEFASRNPWTIFSHEVEPDRVLVVYGTLRDETAHREAGEQLQVEVARRFANVRPPLKSDSEVTDAELAANYVLLVGHPSVNRIADRLLAESTSFPVQFGPQSFAVAGDIHANPTSWVIAAGQNPLSDRHSMVVFAGLDAASTWRSVRDLIESDEPNPQVILNASGKRLRKFRVRSTHSKMP